MMRLILSLMVLVMILAGCEGTSENPTIGVKKLAEVKADYALVIHGGAGTILKENMSAEKEKAYLDMLNEALSVGEQILSNDGTSLDAVVEVIKIMEDSPLFNAGKGAVFTNNGENELDASIMTGIDQQAGAVGGVTTIKNPITAAQVVLEKSKHVLLIGEGAEEFAAKNGCELVENSYFSTEGRLKSLEKARLNDGKGLGEVNQEFSDYKFGTVGCVALDKKGNIVAGTSTGGMTNKKYNRVGDSPIVGAGTYADNSTCGISCTGHGEYFIRYAVAHDISARMEYKGISIDEAAKEVIMEKLVEKGGSGGVVGLDKFGNITMTFNTPGMYRGYLKPGERSVKIYKD